MEISFNEAEISCGFVIKHMQPGYRLANGVVLLHTERDSNGCYFGAVGLDGMYLRTGKRYKPILDDDRRICAFREI